MSVHTSLQGFGEFVEATMKRWHVPGSAVAIVRDGEVLLAEGFGRRNLQTGEPVTAQTVFPVASVTKAFTTMVIGMLAEEGKLSWDTPVKEYLPTFKMQDPFATERITLRDMACHRSGLPRHDLAWWRNDVLTREDMVSRVHHFEPNKDFRTTWQYQNLMYTTAGYIAGLVDGSSWEDLVQRKIFEPLAMKSSSFSVRDVQELANHSRPYQEQAGVVSEMEFNHVDALGPAGSINASVEDLTKWVLLHLGKGKQGEQTLISEQGIKEMHTPHMAANMRPYTLRELPVMTYGLGWFIEPYRGYNMIYHGGNLDGFSTVVSFMPEENIGIVILANMKATAFPTALMLSIYDRLLGLEQIDWTSRLQEKVAGVKAEIEAGTNLLKETTRIEQTMPSHALADYAGEYHHPGYGSIKVREEDGELVIDYHMFSSKMEHFHYDTFAAKMFTGYYEYTVPVVFSTDREGKVHSFTIPLELTPGVQEIKFTRA